jgi:hypothetical protein
VVSNAGTRRTMARRRTAGRSATIAANIRIKVPAIVAESGSQNGRVAVATRPFSLRSSPGPRRGQPTGAAIGSTPARSLRVTRIATSVMTSASTAIPAETRNPFEKPVASAWSVIAFCSAAALAPVTC